MGKPDDWPNAPVVVFKSIPIFFAVNSAQRLRQKSFNLQDHLMLAIAFLGVSYMTILSMCSSLFGTCCIIAVKLE